MSEGGDQIEFRGLGSAARTVVRESVWVLIGGLAFALLANQVSPRGLSLTRDYFGHGIGSPPAVRPAAVSAPGVIQEGTGVDTAVAARLKEKGLEAIGLKEARRLFLESESANERVIFVDARDDANYQTAHIPGAYQLDYYHPENYLLTVIQACQRAETAVVYCQGGDCEDSELAAVLLRQSGVPARRLRVYPGGFTEWTNHALPIESGAGRGGAGSATNP
ncbi:MAG: hypothetical protein KGS61_17730 [Verrucomicrobia bacterium]|nr:hypothetical protein [Verrucomicrobiota bacterium]